jgi:predicted ribosome quality control (RQC) complex YloA/Tae2 family protein
MLSLRELERAARAIEARFLGARLDRVVQREAFELELSLAGGGEPGGRGVLLLSCRPRTARAGLREAPEAAPPSPPPFAQYLRSHLGGARLASARLRDGDRLLSLGFEAREGRFELLLQLLGPRSNLYLLDAQGRLLLSLRPLEETRRDLAGGAAWQPPKSAAPPAGEDRFAGVPDEALLAAIEAHYAAEESGAETESLRRRLARALEKQRAALAKKEKLLRADFAEGERSAEAGRLGELLKSVLAKVPPRASQVEALDFATGERVVIPLDPSLSPAANLEALFKRQKKAERGALRARQELGALEARADELARLEGELAAASDGELEAFAARPELRRLLDRYAPAAAPAPRARPERANRRDVPARLLPRRYRSSDGLEIWVGKNDDGNDYLTTRLARGKDLFFHLEAAPGSHVVLRTEGREDPPAESLLEAGELAVHFSSQKNASRAEVHVAAIKDVSKPKGAKPGLVHVHRGRTLHLRRDPARLARVLEARLEE